MTTARTRESARSLGGATSQTATRFLVAIDRPGSDVPAECPVPGAVRFIESLTRLVKIDFWLRNPDYLADELLTEVESGRQAADAVLPRAAEMIGGSAPSLHRYPRPLPDRARVRGCRSTSRR